MFYKIFKVLCRFWYGLILRTRVIGAENIPASGAFILAANHVSNWDPPFLGTFIDREICYMGKEELFRNPVMAWICRNLHVFPVKRGAADKSAIKTAVKLLRDGNCFGIFPEGTRSKTGKLGGCQLNRRNDESSRHSRRDCQHRKNFLPRRIFAATCRRLRYADKIHGLHQG